MAIGLRSGKHTSARTKSRLRRQVRTRKKVSGTAQRPRLVVTRSSRHMVAQVVDDVQGSTPEAFAKLIQSDLATYAKVIKAANIRID